MGVHLLIFVATIWKSVQIHHKQRTILLTVMLHGFIYSEIIYKIKWLLICLVVSTHLCRVAIPHVLVIKILLIQVQSVITYLNIVLFIASTR